MQEAKFRLGSKMRQVVLPLLIAAVLVVGALLACGSSLIRIEDVYINRILAGTYGTPDWRVQEMNPLLAQLLTLLYRILSAVNWYGVLLLALLLCAAASAMSLAARKPGGLLPAAILLSPIVVLLTHSMQSTVVAGMCVVAGAFSLMEGIRRKGEGHARTVTGALLFVFGAMLSLPMACVLAVGVVICWLPCCAREHRMKSLIVSVPVMAVLLAALFGYSALMYASPELSAYRENYHLYEKLQHSSLYDEYKGLIADYGVSVFSGNDGHDHAQEETSEQGDVTQQAGSFAAAGWGLNDADLFFSRFGSDTVLLDAQALQTLEAEASYISFDMRSLFASLIATVKKPQFLLMLALFIITALATVLTSRRRGLVALLTAIFAFGGHIFLLMCYYDAFNYIAPFYLLGILALLYYFDGESASQWLHGVCKTKAVRVAVCAVVLVGFVGCLGGFGYYLRSNPASTEYAGSAYTYLTDYVQAHPDVLFIGDNPNDRYKPDTLAAPQRGADANLLAGSYDLYSPRAAAQMARFGITNPLADSIDREDIAYINMSFYQMMAFRLIDAYGVKLNIEPILEDPMQYGEAIYALQSYTQEEYDAALSEAEAQAAEQAAAEEALLAALEEALAEPSDGAESPDGAEKPDAAESPASETTPAPDASAEPSPSPEATADNHA